MPTQQQETIGQMKARFPAALEDVIDIESVVGHPELLPALASKHIFDFADGMRIVVSADNCGGRVFVHVSVSGDKRYFKTIKNQQSELTEDIWLRLAALAGREPPPVVKNFSSSDGVIHLFFDVDKFSIKETDRS